MVLPFLAMQKVEIVCPHCEHVNVRLASAVQRGVTITCEQCKRRFRVRELRTRVGTAPAKR